MYIQSKFEDIDFYFCTPLGAVCSVSIMDSSMNITYEKNIRMGSKQLAIRLKNTKKRIDLMVQILYN